jgi:hypothetical protein
MGLLKPEGIAGQIAALKIGESYSIARRVPLGEAKAADKVTTLRAFVKNRLSPHVARAKAQSGNIYTTETGVVTTHDNAAMLVVAVVTRLKGATL